MGKLLGKMDRKGRPSKLDELAEKYRAETMREELKAMYQAQGSAAVDILSKKILEGANTVKVKTPRDLKDLTAVAIKLNEVNNSVDGGTKEIKITFSKEDGWDD